MTSLSQGLGIDPLSFSVSFCHVTLPFLVVIRNRRDGTPDRNFAAQENNNEKGSRDAFLYFILCDVASEINWLKVMGSLTRWGSLLGQTNPRDSSVQDG
ncbi:hypothetical protein AVEN_48806-1 [Araneus ventricosus]|uniref:Uncharacterized protein n=1 Tax=Araneus ventricosus TaxID=182803 RepID=A0A4Y2IGC9_ARAVE|nr:hypothetical protein AVEN_48806-1 [Araneus ventricosus]